jgi:hypothetical protein
MADPAEALHGIVRGKLIELDRSPGLPDGEAVVVQLRPVQKPGDRIQRSAGAWAGDDEELDRFLVEARRSRIPGLDLADWLAG